MPPPLELAAEGRPTDPRRVHLGSPERKAGGDHHHGLWSSTSWGSYGHLAPWDPTPSPFPAPPPLALTGLGEGRDSRLLGQRGQQAPAIGALLEAQNQEGRKYGEWGPGG